ncbi:MAG: Flp pilus assembly protein CpaB [Phycicoccus sp.]
MTRRQRRGVLLLVLSAVVAVLVFAVVTSYVRSISSQVGPMTTVYAATAPIGAYTALGPENLEARRVPVRWTAPTARLALDKLQGRRTSFRLEAGTVVTADMLVPPSDLKPTEREIALEVDAVTGLVGRVRPGDRVDIYAVFADVPGLPAQVRVLVRDIRVVSIGGRQTVTETDADTGAQQNEILPVTLALEPGASLSVTFAAAFAEQVRLVALPTDRGTNREKDVESFDAGNLGGVAVPGGGAAPPPAAPGGTR